MAQITVSDKTLAEFNRLLAELHTLYPQQELSNDQIMEAMLGGFFDSLAYMQKGAESSAHHGHHHHGDEGCCGGKDDCENKKDGACCGQHH